jgi:hypothetical protein
MGGSGGVMDCSTTSKQQRHPKSDREAGSEACGLQLLQLQATDARCDTPSRVVDDGRTQHRPTPSLWGRRSTWVANLPVGVVRTYIDKQWALSDRCPVIRRRLDPKRLAMVLLQLLVARSSVSSFRR